MLCLYLLLVKRLDEDCVNEVLNSACQTYYAYSSHLEKIHSTAKNCFGTIKSYIIKTAVAFNRNFIMTSSCAYCLKKLIFDFLCDYVVLLCCLNSSDDRNLFLLNFSIIFLSLNYTFCCNIFNLKRKKNTLLWHQNNF